MSHDIAHLRPDATDSVILETLGARLRQLRIEADFSQRDLADHAGVSRSTVERMESGASTSTQNLVRVLRALGGIERLDAAFALPDRSPLQAADDANHARRPQRVRRSPGVGPSSADSPATAWQWGDES